MAPSLQAPASSVDAGRPGRALRPRWRPFLLLLVLAGGGLAGWFLASRLWVPQPPAPALPLWPVTASTIAGGGTPGRADGVVSAALFSDPFGVAVDAAGNTFVTDAGDNNMVRRMAPDGTVSVVAGGTEGWRDGRGAEARFHTPSAVALAPDGTLVVADTGNHAIRRVTADGRVSTVAGGRGRGQVNGPASQARFDGPVGVTVGRDGSIFVADTYNDSVRRISPDGIVTTVAGGLRTGFRDGAGDEAWFDTPSGIAVDARGMLFVADTGNNLMRRIDRFGRVTTVAAPGRIAGVEAGVGLWRPTGVAAGRGGEVYVSDGQGRVHLVAPDGSWRVIAGSRPGFADGAGRTARFNSPAGIAVDARGVVRVADSDNYLVRALTPPGAQPPARDFFLSAIPLLSPAALGFVHVPWPVAPQYGWHELTSTLGEARGRIGGDGRERLHAGLDVHAAPGTVVRAVHDEKVTRPIAAGGYDDLNEMLRAGLLAYVHVKVGRDERDRPLDPSRFTILYDDDGYATRVRVRRGTRLALGDPLGVVNRFAHVHLGLGPPSAEVNLLRFSLAEFGDHVSPVIPAAGVQLLAESGAVLARRRGRVEVSGRVKIVAEAWDQVDRNRKSRRLGVYSLGYQVLDRHGRPARGYEEPRTTIEFDRLPQTGGAAALAYAEGSGITVHGNRTTRFRYVVTNEVRGGEAREGWWDTSTLAPGEYRLRIIASDLAGNSARRDMPVRVTAAAPGRPAS